MARCRQASSNSAMNSEPPSTWMASTLKGMSAVSLSRNIAAEAAVARLVGLGDGPFGDRIVGGEVLDVAARGERHIDGVELHDLAGLGGLGGLGQALGEAASCGPFSREKPRVEHHRARPRIVVANKRSRVVEQHLLGHAVQRQERVLQPVEPTLLRS